jgi:hypothetical protein
MPKIIKRGSAPRRDYEGTCLSCGCVAEWTPSEVLYSHYTGEPYGATVGKCPQCGNSVCVRQKDK